MDTIVVHVINFKREEKSKYEKGVCIGEGGTIIDLEGKVVKSAWDASDAYNEGCFKLIKSK